MNKEQVENISQILNILYDKYRGTEKSFTIKMNYIRFCDGYIVISPMNTKYAMNYYMEHYPIRGEKENKKRLKQWNGYTYEILMIALQEILIGSV